MFFSGGRTMQRIVITKNKEKSKKEANLSLKKLT